MPRVFPREGVERLPRIFNQMDDDSVSRVLQEEQRNKYPFNQLSEITLRFNDTFVMFNNELRHLAGIRNHKVNAEGDVVGRGLYASLRKVRKGKKDIFVSKDFVECNYDNFSPFLPDSQMYNVTCDDLNHVLYLVRLPTRQNKKSYCDSIYEWHSPFDRYHYELTDKIYTHTMSARSMRILEAGPDHTPYKEAVDMVRGLEALGRAFSDKFYVGISQKHGVIVGYKNLGACGYVAEDNTVLLPPSSHHLYEMLSEHTNCRRL